MDPDRQRIEDDLRGTLAGDVRCDDLFMQLYASDASIYEMQPLGIVRPRTLGDVVATAQYASEHGLSLHARGAGSGLAGGSLGRGLIIDFSRYLRRIVWTGETEVRVQAGVVLDVLNRHLAKSGRQFGPDPATSQVTTLGGVVATDASGSHWARYGSARRHVRSLKCVLADGEELELARHPVAPSRLHHKQPRLRSLVEAVKGLLERHAETIARYQCQSLVNSSGYQLSGILSDGKLDLASLIVGSEGTLALVTEITLATDRLPMHRGCVLLLFDSLDKAARAALEIEPLQPAACDLMDRRHLNLARESDNRYETLIPREAEAVLLVEQDADTRELLHDKLEAVVQQVHFESGLAAAAHIGLDEPQITLFADLARRFTPTLYRLRGSSRPIPCVEDIAVPPSALPVFLRHLLDTLKRHQVTASLLGHAGHGQLHIRPFLDLGSRDDVHKMETLASELYEKVWLLGGTISGKHGDGLSRTPFLARQHGPLVNVFAELKRIFDPQGILNPGRIVPDSGRRMTQNLRQVECRVPTPAIDEPENTTAEYAPLPGQPVELQLEWQPQEMTLAARSCNGCGACRAVSPEVRMCPIFRYAPREEASPRAKANLVRGLLTGSLPHDEWVQEACKEVADLCVHCHMCRLECPANVDIPKMMLEAKAQFVRTNGYHSLQDWALVRIDTMSAWAGRFPGLTNRLLAAPQARWILEKLLGVAQGRKLPQLARRSFLRQALVRRLHRPPRATGEKVAFFVDTYANHYDPQLAEALVAILRHHDVPVFVPRDQKHSAMPMIARGALEPARQVAEHNVSVLAEAVRRGYTVLSTEPSAVLALTHEYPLILDQDDDARLVADHTMEACQFLWQLHRQARLKLDFATCHVSAGYHLPCHQRALGGGSAAAQLLELVPGLRLTRLEKGCSGMAGMFGIRHSTYRSSLRAGLDLISTMRRDAFQIGTTECSTCKMQMEQSTSKPTIHPIKLLAWAYGLMPEVGQLVKKRGKPLIVT